MGRDNPMFSEDRDREFPLDLDARDDAIEAPRRICRASMRSVYFAQSLGRWSLYDRCKNTSEPTFGIRYKEARSPTLEKPWQLPR